MKICIPLLVVLAAWMQGSECLARHESDVAIVMDLKGKATFDTGDKQDRAVELADCLYAGDRIDLASDAELILIFSAGGTREEIKGPGVIHIGETGSRIEDPTASIRRSDLDYLPGDAVVDLGLRYAATPLRGDADLRPDAVRLLSLCETRTRHVSPEFRWREVDGADGYRIALFDANDEQILQTTTDAPVFRLPRTVLERGATYCWAVAALDGDETGAAEAACFSVLSAQQLENVERMEKKVKITFPGDHPEKWIALALLYQKFELFDETADVLGKAAEKFPENENIEKWRRVNDCR
jgi:hypothetical protein